MAGGPISPQPLPPGFVAVSLPASLRRQPLMQLDPLYVLPSALLKNLRDTTKHPLLDRKHVVVERALARHCKRHGIVGYSRGMPVYFDLLEDPNQQVDMYRNLICEYCRLSGRRPLSPRDRAALRRRVAGAVSVQRGYAGWLMTNTDYRSELKALESRWQTMITKHGLPAVGLTWMAATTRPGKARSSHDRYLCDLADFCVRWRLQGLVSLELPVPLGPHVPIAEPKLLLNQMRTGGFSMFLPDTFPVPSREQLREIGLEIQAQRLPGHLAGWGGIVRREHGNTAGIERYGHILAIQHYWSILKTRHDGVFKGNVRHIDEALGAFLGTSSENVRKLRRQIHQRLRG